MGIPVKISPRHASLLRNKHGITDEAIAVSGLHSVGDEIVLLCRSLDGKPAGCERRASDGQWYSQGLGPSPAPMLITRNGASDILVWAQDATGGLALLSADVPAVAWLPGAAEAAADGRGANARAFLGLLAGSRLVPELARFKRHVLAFDDAPTGDALRAEMSIRIRRDRCYFPTFGAGMRSVADVLAAEGADGIDALLSDCRPLVPDQLVRPSEIARSTSVSLSTGCKALDPHLQLCLPELFVLSGVPNAGKSQWALWLVANLARVHGMSTAIIQFEDDVDRHRDDLERYARAWQNGEGPLVKLEPEAWVDRYFRMIARPETLQNTEDQTLSWLFDRLEEASVRHGCKVALIDPWNEISHADGERESTYTGNALRQIKAVARRLQMLIIVIAHPSKHSGLNVSNPESLSLYDIAGSSHWANKADHGVMLFREKGSHITTVNVVKCRDYRKHGTPGMIDMKLDLKSATFVPEAA